MSKQFQLANPLWWVIIPGGFVIIFLLAFYPDVIPFSHFVSNYRTLLIIVLWSIVIAHLFEALIARRICQRLTIDSQSTLLWVIQTFVLGILILYIFISIFIFFFYGRISFVENAQGISTISAINQLLFSVIFFQVILMISFFL